MVLRELTTTGTSEIPDALGWRGNETVLVECKTSRADFLAERSKPHRREPDRGMGRYRYFLCPPDLISADELPAKWGLLYAQPRNVKVVVGKDPRAWGCDWEEGWEAWAFDPRHWRAEQQLLRSMLNRLKLSLGQAEFDRLIHLPYHGRKAEMEEMQDQGEVVVPNVLEDPEIAALL